MPFGFDKLVAAVLIAALMLVAAERAQAQAPSVPASAPICIYESESYSDGAYLCIRKGLMLGCALSASKANWSVVADRELSKLCNSGDYRTRLAPRQHYAQRRRPVEAAAPTQVSAPPQVSAKCFSFNGKNYCE